MSWLLQPRDGIYSLLSHLAGKEERSLGIAHTQEFFVSLKPQITKITKLINFLFFMTGPALPGSLLALYAALSSCYNCCLTS